MRDRVLGYIREHELMKAGDRVGVAVSGGADSVALLRLLLELREELGTVLSVVHFNHKIRGAEADQDEQFVAALAGRHGLEFHLGSEDVPAYARAHNLGLEAAGRTLRYRFFQRLSGSARLTSIATGHMLDDQAETVLMRILRGAGTKGLAGISPKLRLAASAEAEPGLVVRPLLGTRRREVRGWLEGIGQQWREDTSNLDPKHLRNRIRQQLLPLLERDFNPGVVEVLADLAEIARGDDEYFNHEVGRVLAAGVLGGTANQPTTLKIEALAALPLGIRRRAVRKAFETAGCPLDFKHVEAVLRLVTTACGKSRCELSGGWTAVRLGRELRLEKRGQPHKGPSGYEYRLRIPGEVVVKEIGAAIKAFLQPGTVDSAGYNRGCSLDAGSLQTGLVVRNWRPGDRFWPPYTKAPKKIKELLQEKRVPQTERRLWPVVICGETILWVRGFSAVPVKLTDGSNRELVIEESKMREAATGDQERPLRESR